MDSLARSLRVAGAAATAAATVGWALRWVRHVCRKDSAARWPEGLCRVVAVPLPPPQESTGPSAATHDNACSSQGQEATDTGDIDTQSSTPATALATPLAGTSQGPAGSAQDQQTGSPVRKPSTLAHSQAGPAQITVYVLPTDSAHCEIALQGLLPRLMPDWQHSSVQPEPEQGDPGPQPIAGHSSRNSRDNEKMRGSVRGDTCCVLGLDIEWQPERDPGQRNPVSVLQLSGPHTCLILRPHRLSHGCPHSLRSVLENPGVVKVGVGVQEDCRRICEMWGVNVQGVVELRLLSQLCVPQLVSSHGSSLSALCEGLLHRTLDKGQQCSDWARRRLSRAQITYAVQDAWASQAIAHVLYNHALTTLHNTHTAAHTAAETHTVARTPHTAGHTANTPAQQEPASMRQFLAPFLDKFKIKQVQRAVQAAMQAVGPGGRYPFQMPVSQGPGGLHAVVAQQQRSDHASALAAASVQSIARVGMSVHATPFVTGLARVGSSETSVSVAGLKQGRFALRKHVLYENCRIQAPDGATLCTCSQKKVQWYLSRGLGEILCDEPYTLRLFFEPAGRGHQDDKYYQADKLNQCVVCGLSAQHVQQSNTQTRQSSNAADDTAHQLTDTGSTERTDKQYSTATGNDSDSSTEPYLRHSIVPHCYRRHFPVHCKSHLSHDIVLLCINCHQVSSAYNQQRMEELGRLYNAPLEEDNHKYKHDTALGRVKAAARALINPKVRLPQARRAELLTLVAQHHNVSEDKVTQAMLEADASLDARKPAAEWSSHAAKVVSALQGDIEGFVRGWRAHFLQSMQPRHLPPHWSVDARVANSSSSSMAQAKERQGDGGQ